jgi:hypothetical protein
MIGMIFVAALAGTATDAESRVADAPTRYTPEIRGQLLDGAKPVTSNVCLRQSESEIRMCGYTDNSGNFYIPAHSTRPVAGSTSTTPPTFWLEIGRVTEARKIAPIDASEKKGAVLALECNLSHSPGASDAKTLCERRAASAPSRVSQAEPARRHSSAHPAK